MVSKSGIRLFVWMLGTLTSVGYPSGLPARWRADSDCAAAELGCEEPDRVQPAHLS